MKRFTILLIVLFLVRINNIYSQEYQNPDDKNWITIDSARIPAGIDGTAHIWGIDCYDSLHCAYFAGDLLNSRSWYSVRITDDGGKTWRTIRERNRPFEQGPYHSPERRMFFMPKKDMIVVYLDSGYVLRTTDAGDTWSKEKVSNDGTNFGVYHNYMRGFMVENVGIASWGFDKVYITEDYGASWKKLNYMVSRLSGIHLVNPNLIVARHWLRNQNDEIVNYWFRSTNKGSSWELITERMEHERDPYRFFHFLNEKLGYALRTFEVNQDSTLLKTLKTMDGGESWDVIDEIYFSGNRTWGLNVSICDSSNFITDDLSYGILITSNGGYTWDIHKPSFDNIANIYTAIKQHSPNNILLGLSNRLLRYVGHIVSVDESIDSKISTQLYPNPTSEILHIRTDELISRVELSDLLGNVVKTHTSDVLKTSDEFKSSDVFETSDVLKLNVENLPAGMYFLKLYTASGEVLVEKVIVGF